jgi:small-conductance mechanosensitive channel
MQGILYEEPSFWLFALITVIMGGWAAWMTGRACAKTWRSYGALFVSLLALGVAVRFIHHALFEGTMFSLHYYIVDTIILMILGFIGYQYTRTNQMVNQYGWLYQKASPLSWKAKS